ncbi:MAG: hypothetical protein WA052_00250 [Microgenomates group bacterium]
MAVHFLASFLDRVSGLFNKKSLPPTIELYEPINVSRPDVEFRVLSSLAKQNVYFIDLDTTNYIDGLIYLPSIGLTLTPPPPQKTIHTNLGFLNLDTKREVSTHPNPDVAEIDAVLYFEYEGRECKTGLLDNGLAYLFFIKIWNDLDFIIWEKIIEKVIKDLTLDIEWYPVPRVNFTVTTTFIPNKPTEASKLVISRPDDNSDASFAVSNHTVSTPENGDEEFDDEDDDEEYEEFKTPRPRY